MNFPEREHGLPESPLPDAPPVAKLAGPIDGVEPECPNCGCVSVHEITVQMTNPLLTAGKGVGRYLGCPACPWASPMVTVSHGAKPLDPEAN